MKKLRVLVLVHEDLVPPESLDGIPDDQIREWKTEFDVITTLREVGHDVHPLGVVDDLGKIRRAILDWKPHITFNLLEEFHGIGVFDQHVVSYLELMRQPYTGCNPRGLMLSRDKPLGKKILHYHRIATPRFVVFPLGRAVKPPKRSPYPLLVKSTVEDASLGITQDSVVSDETKLIEQVARVHNEVKTDALVEEYIEGRELYVGVMGNQRLQTFPVWEMVFEKKPDDMRPIATRRVKWDVEFQKKIGLKTHAATNLPTGIEEKINRLCKRIYRALDISGYARMDLRLTADDEIYVLEANPNPNLEYGEDLAESAEAAGISYEALLRRILNLGLRYHAPWRG